MHRYLRRRIAQPTQATTSIHNLYSAVYFGDRFCNEATTRPGRLPVVGRMTLSSSREVTCIVAFSRLLSQPAVRFPPATQSQRPNVSVAHSPPSAVTLLPWIRRLVILCRLPSLTGPGT